RVVRLRPLHPPRRCHRLDVHSALPSSPTRRSPDLVAPRGPAVPRPPGVPAPGAAADPIHAPVDTRDVALPAAGQWAIREPGADEDRESTRLNSSHVKISYAVFCLDKQKNAHRRAPM